MRRDEIADLAAFVVVAEERSFTKAAKRLGLAQSALSQIIQRIEDRLKLRLLTRTTRSVAPTQEGERLLASLGPMLHELDHTITTLSDLRGRPAGTIRLTAVEHAVKTIVLPAMQRLLPANPDIKLAITIDYGFVDVVAERFDAGIRLGGEIAKDMIAVRIGPDIPIAIVGAPDYFKTHPAPTSPAQLIDHQAINLLLPKAGDIKPWRLIRAGRETRIHVESVIAVNSIDLALDATRAGLGLSYLPLDQVQTDLDTGRLVRVLSKFTPDLPGYHLYYPNRRHASAAFKVFVEALRYSG